MVICDTKLFAQETILKKKKSLEEVNMDNYWIMELWLFCGCVVCLLTLWSLWFSYDTLIGCCLYPQFDSVGFGQATQCVGEVLPSSLFFCSWRLFFTQKCRFFCLLDVIWSLAHCMTNLFSIYVYLHNFLPSIYLLTCVNGDWWDFVILFLYANAYCNVVKQFKWGAMLFMLDLIFSYPC